MSRSRFVLALAGLTGIIVYGSLYPFDFCRLEFPGGPLHALLSTWRERTTLGDMLANILLYLPFGFCAVQSLRAPRWVRAPLSLASGIALSASLEFLQLYDQGRWASMSDIRSNAAGVLLGTIAGLIFEPVRSRLPSVSVRVQPFVLILLACLAGYRLFPYVPVIDLHKYWHAVRPLLEPEISAVAICRHAAMWLAVALMLEEILGAAASRPAVAVLFLTVLAVRVFMDGVILSASEVAGGALGVLLWALWLAGANARAGWICGLFLLNVLVQGLAPFHFTARGHGYVWIPFYSVLEGEPRIAIPSVFEKAFNYGTLLWLLTRSAFGRLASAAIGAALVMGLSLAHIYMPQRTAEITDLALLLSMALAGVVAGGWRASKPKAG